MSIICFIKSCAKKVIKRIRMVLPHASDYMLDSLRKKGASIGKGVIIYDPNSVIIDSSRPWLLEIGEYTKITHGTVILTHDYSLSTMRRVYGNWIGEGQVTSIGNNCFIGVNSVILMGAHIGNNVIVGAGSVVHGNIPDNVVVGGNPAKIICTLEEHYRKRISLSPKEAINCAVRYREVYKKDPLPIHLQGFKFLFTPRDPNVVKKYGLSFQCNGDEPQDVEKSFYDSQPVWSDYNSFMNDVNDLTQREREL